MAAYIHRHRQPGNVGGVGLNIYTQCCGLAAKSLRPDVQCVDLLQQLLLQRRIVRVWIATGQWATQRLLCQQSRFVKGAAEADADDDRRARVGACADAGVKALVGKIATGDLFVGDSATKAAIEAKCAPDCVEMEGAAVSQIAAKNGVPCVILRAMSDNADEDGHEVLVVKKFSITEYVATATKIVAAMVESL